MDYQPTILAFLCNWCAYTGADLAGTSRMKYASSVRIIRVMCSGRIEPTFVLEAFRQGADGVLICGCHPGDCHYQSGNYKCLRRYLLLKKYITEMGIEEERLSLEWISASEGRQFAFLVDQYTEKIKNLGPSRIPKNSKILAENEQV
jgi:F420-non-reducing hydrogenase iron-sulfur subunit